MKRIGIYIAAIALMLAGCSATNSAAPAKSGKSSVIHHHHFSWIRMLSPDSGWALGSNGSTVYHTANGVAWTSSGPTRHSLRSPYGSILYPLSVNEAWYADTVNGSTIGLYHTTDGAKLWTYQTLHFAYIPGVQGSDPLGGPVSISFAGQEDGWIMVAPGHGMSTEPGVLYRTVDGGATWRVVASTYASSGTLTLPSNGNISFTGPQNGWLVGSETTTSPRLLYRTTDGGAHWSKVSFPVAKGMSRDAASVLSPPTFSGDAGAMAVQFFGTGSSVIYESATGGAAWQFAYAESPAHGQTGYSLVDIIRVAPKILAFTYDAEFSNISYVEGTNRTSSTWTTSGRIPKRWLPKGTQVSELDFVNQSDGWVIIENQTGTNPPTVLRTTDSGKSWSRV